MKYFRIVCLIFVFPIKNLSGKRWGIPLYMIWLKGYLLPQRKAFGELHIFDI